MFRFLSLIAIVGILSACTSNQVEPEVDCTIDGPTAMAISTPSGCELPTGTISVEVTGGEGPFTFMVNTIPSQENSSGSFDQIDAGNFVITIMDANNCSISVDVTVESAEGPSINDVSTMISGCGTENGSLSVSASGGEGTLMYSLDGLEAQEEDSFDRLAAGTYQLTVSDEGGCETIQEVQILSGVSLENDIKPIIESNCALATCHGGARSPDMTTRSGIIAVADRIRARTTAGTMPPSGALPDSQIDAIACWVADGAPEN
jgi:hypothetical protein